jgi:hypothetical protein
MLIWACVGILVLWLGLVLQLWVLVRRFAGVAAVSGAVESLFGDRVGGGVGLGIRFGGVVEFPIDTVDTKLGVASHAVPSGGGRGKNLRETMRHALVS